MSTIKGVGLYGRRKEIHMFRGDGRYEVLDRIYGGQRKLKWWFLSSFFLLLLYWFCWSSNKGLRNSFYCLSLSDLCRFYSVFAIVSKCEFLSLKSYIVLFIRCTVTFIYKSKSISMYVHRLHMYTFVSPFYNRDPF